MHHKNHKNSTANHSNPQHQKPAYPSAPAPQSAPKRSALSRIRDRFKEKPATAEEVKQLGLDAKREYYKTLKAKSKAGRPSRFSGFGGPPPPRRSGRAVQQDSGLFGGSGDSSWLMGPSSGPTLDFITGANSKSRGRKDTGFGQGLTDLF